MSRSTAAILLVLLLVLPASPGCRSFQGNLLRRDVVAQAPPTPEQPDPTELVRRVAQEHDRRSVLVQSMKSDLNVSIDAYRDQAGRERQKFLGILGGTAEGSLVMERPKNLYIQLNKLSKSLAVIGSNDREFWFANDMAHELVVGDYAQAENYADPLLASVRPEWIFEVLGLEPIAPDAEISDDDSAGTVTLVERRTLGNGSTMLKESVLSVAEQRVVEHRLYTDGRRELIARARVDQLIAVPVGKAVGEERPETIQLPRVVRLTVPEVAELTLNFGHIRLNPSMDFASREGTFERPERPKYNFVDLFEVAGQQGQRLADASPSPSATLPIASTAPPSTAPGSLVLPRSDQDVARTEDRSAGGRRFAEPPSAAGTIPLDLPSAPRLPAMNTQRSTWSTIEGNRFRRDVLGRD